ncbi:hypothetical protein [Gilvimarinus sp. DA14]|uniref:hypothetical protein n=1 Tax=Gilvimarinus sp. DA14 TaxID=2956798 RepID=UPI0020B7C500|nr:hypothetical protein [Gilvimarinus sp. DA14]UTF61800.1 hypothetical protein NHM04_08415 [Gilvimarinus sp. DA14]
MLSENKIKPLSAIFLALMLSACGDSETNIYAQDVAEPEEEHDHDHDEETSAARLLLVEEGTEMVHIFEAGDGDEVAELSLPAPIGYAYPVPGYRYAAFVHRDDNWVSFVDGGVWVEDHGDHDHPYAEAPAIQDFYLDGVKPTHYTFNDEQVAVFYDGNSETGDVAGVATFDSAAVAENGMAATLNFDTYMHGAAQVRGEHLLATIRDADSASTLPDKVGLYHLHDTEYELETVFSETCPGLHGSAQNEDQIFFGCTDGVLVIDESADFAATKVANGTALAEGVRVGSLRAHHHVDEVIGIASGGLVRVVPGSDELQPMPEPLHEEDTVVASDFAADGEFFVALTSEGALVVLDSHDWGIHGELSVTDASALGEGQGLKLIVPPAGHHVYVLNPGSQSLVEVDIEALAADEPWSLEFTPSAGVWLGYASEEEAHDHDH